MKNKTLVPIILLSLNLIFSQNVIEKEFAVKPGKTLDIDLKTGGTIDITGWDNEQVKVVVQRTGDDCETVDIDFSERSSGLYISAQYNQKWFDHDCNLDFDIQVPTKFDVEVETMGGDINIDNVEGDLEGKTMGGELYLSRIKGEVGMTTMGGEIRLKNSDVDGWVKTMGGMSIFKMLQVMLKVHPWEETLPIKM